LRPENTSRYIYRVDADDIICYVDPHMVSFAKENGAPHLTLNALVGQPLFGFIAGLETRHLSEVLMERVREYQRVVEVPFRCDAPAYRRFMRLRISPLADSGLQFES
jgi:hypothetical protein